MKSARWLSGLLGGLIFLSLGGFGFLGCREKTPKVSDKIPQSQLVTIQVSTWGSAEEVQVFRRLLADFESRHPKIHVDLLHIPDQYYQKLHILIAGGLTPDVMFTNSLYFPVYASQGIFADLTPFLRQSQSLKGGDFFAHSLEAFRAYDSIKNKKEKDFLGAIPRDISNLVVFYNQDLFQKYQVSFPSSHWTWEDFLKIAHALTRDENQDGIPEQFGFSFYRTPPMYWLPLVWSQGGDLFNEDMSQFQLTSNQATDAIQLYGDLRNRYHVSPRQIESGAATMTQMFLQQRLAMMVGGRWSVPVFRKQATFQWDVVNLPHGSKGSRTGIDASGYAMARQSLHPQEAWALIEFLSSRSSVEAFCESGLIVPARIDVAQSERFLSSSLPPAHSQTFIDVISNGVPTRTPPRWNEVAEILTQALEPVWEGKIGAKEALLKVEPGIEKLLPQSQRRQD